MVNKTKYDNKEQEHIDEQGVWVEARYIEKGETIRTQRGWMEVVEKPVVDDKLVAIKVKSANKRPAQIMVVKNYKLLVRDRIVPDDVEDVNVGAGGEAYQVALMKDITALTYQGLRYNDGLYEVLTRANGEENRIAALQAFMEELLNATDELLAEQYSVATRELLRAYIKLGIKHINYRELVRRFMQAWGVK